MLLKMFLTSVDGRKELKINVRWSYFPWVAWGTAARQVSNTCWAVDEGHRIRWRWWVLLQLCWTTPKRSATALHLRRAPMRWRVTQMKVVRVNSKSVGCWSLFVGKLLKSLQDKRPSQPMVSETHNSLKELEAIFRIYFYKQLANKCKSAVSAAFVWGCYAPDTKRLAQTTKHGEAFITTHTEERQLHSLQVVITPLYCHIANTLSSGTSNECRCPSGFCVALWLFFFLLSLYWINQSPSWRYQDKH